MRKLMILSLSLIVLTILSGCKDMDLSKLSDEDMQRIAEKAIICNPPYMRFGMECCLDTNNNNICDDDEKKGIEIEPQTIMEAETKNCKEKTIYKCEGNNLYVININTDCTEDKSFILNCEDDSEKCVTLTDSYAACEQSIWRDKETFMETCVREESDRDDCSKAFDEIVSQLSPRRSELEEEFYNKVKKGYKLKLENITEQIPGPAGAYGNYAAYTILDENGKETQYSDLCPADICESLLIVDNDERYELLDSCDKGCLYYHCPQKENCLEDKGYKAYSLWIGIVNDEYPDGYGLTSTSSVMMGN